MYELLVLLHIVSGIAWVGGGLIEQLAVTRAFKAGGAQAADQMMRSLSWMEMVIYMPAPILVLGSGIAMVAVRDEWQFSQTWVYLAIGLIVLAGVLGGGVGGRLQKTMEGFREAGEVDSPGYATALAKMSRTGAIELAVMLVLIGLMVYKPGV